MNAAMVEIGEAHLELIEPVGTEGTIVVNANGGRVKATIQSDRRREPEELPIAEAQRREFFQQLHRARK